MTLKITELNHVALHISDVEASIAFYRDGLGLKQLPRPEFDFEGAWFELPDGRQIHLIAGRSDPANSHNRGTHFALHVEDFDAAVEHVKAKGLRHHPPKPRPDGALQIFLMDPDDHYIELCDNRPADPARRTRFP
ncbi:glyoxalase [Planctomycetales bacterium ZRK34]|nr:glyoxalase [Planctomycetales bacterium ZRK34]